MFTNIIYECYIKNDTISGSYVINVCLYLSKTVEIFTFSIKVS